MKKIIVSIIVIGLLLSTAPLSISGKESVEEHEEVVATSSSGYLETIISNPNDNLLNEPKFAPGEVIVKFNDDVDVSISVSTNRASTSGATTAGTPDGTVASKGDESSPSDEILMTGIESVDELSIAVIAAEKLIEDDSIPSLANVYKFILDEDANVLAAVESYNNDPSVEFAEPNYIYRPPMIAGEPRQPIQVYPSSSNSGFIPNDPYFDMQWGLHNTGQNGGTPDADIDAPDAWDIQMGDDDVVIAIIDTGVDYTHSDLSDNIFNESLDPSLHYIDRCGHGTHCAGIAAAVTNNSSGISGVAGNCKIMSRRAMNILGLILAWRVAWNIVSATGSGANVISMSLGGPPSILIGLACKYAFNRNVVLVAAAGNENDCFNGYPAAFDNVIAVAATDQNDSRAGFSTYGSWVDVAAPGVDILSLRAAGTDMYGDGTHIVDEDYYIASGTSMACPHIAGVIGLILSEAKKQGLTLSPLEVKTILRSSTDKKAFDRYIGIGRINAYTALQKTAAITANLDSSLDNKDVQGMVKIKGIARGEQFKDYKVECGRGIYPDDNSWIYIKTSSIPKNVSSALAQWDTTQVSEGLYTIKLTINAGEFSYEDETLVRVDNKAETYYVNDDYYDGGYNDGHTWGYDAFDKIMDAIDHCGKKDTIYVCSGTYYEQLIVGMGRSIKLIGEDRNTTIINSSKTKWRHHDTIRVDISDISISDFTLKTRRLPGQDPKYYSIKGSSVRPCEISNNKFIDSKGINLRGLQNSVIYGNTFIDGSIIIEEGTKNTISGNTVKRVCLKDLSVFNDICSNNISNGGITLITSPFNKVHDNIISNCIHGILLDADDDEDEIVKSRFNIISNNTITNNNYGVYIKTNSNEIYQNNFITNNQNAYDEGNNIWYKPLLLSGNYWDDYEDIYVPPAKPRFILRWIWNTPYEIPDGDDNPDNNSKDLYPLVNQYSGSQSSSQSTPQSNPSSQPSSQLSSPTSTPSSQPSSQLSSPTSTPSSSLTSR